MKSTLALPTTVSIFSFKLYLLLLFIIAKFALNLELDLISLAYLYICTP